MPKTALSDYEEEALETFGCGRINALLSGDAAVSIEIARESIRAFVLSQPADLVDRAYAIALQTGRADVADFGLSWTHRMNRTWQEALKILHLQASGK